MNTKFRKITLFLISLVIALVLECVQLATQPKMIRYDYALNDVGHAIFPREEALYHHAVYENGVFIPRGEDPVVMLDTGNDGSVHSVLITLSKAPATSVLFQVFYDDDGTGYTEEDSIWSSFLPGQLTAAIELPLSVYLGLRFDFEGELSVESIQVSDGGYMRSEGVVLKENMHVDRVVLVAIFLFAIMLLWSHFCVTVRIKGEILSVYNYVYTDWKKRLIEFALLGGFAVLGSVMLYHLLWYCGFKATMALKIFCIVVSATCTFVIACRKLLSERPEYVFAIIALSVGMLLVCFIPASVQHTWDEAYHFRNALNVTYVDEIRYTDADWRTYRMRIEPVYETQKIISQSAQMNEYWDRGALTYESHIMNEKAIWAIPSGILMFLGRVFDAPYQTMVCLGKLGNLLLYVLLGSLAIWKTKNGKMILAVILLAPTNLFMASSYSYDPFITAMTMLAFALYFDEWRRVDEPVSFMNIIIMLTIMLVGVQAKAIYAVMSLVFLCMPNSKFKNKKQRYIYYSLTIGATILMMASFLLPFFAQVQAGTAVGDTRGGSDVNATNQVAFILSHPLKYTKILLGFLMSYFAPENSSGYLTRLAYLGAAPNSSLILVLLTIVAFTDWSGMTGFEGKKWYVKGYSLFIFFGTICLVASSLYVGFTPVGLGTINGCQARYLTPLLFPVIYLLGSIGVENKMNRAVYNGMVLTVAAYIAFAAVLEVIITRYL